MWANAQHDGRPAEYRWRTLFNTAKFGCCLLLLCRAVALPRRKTCWNLHGCPKLANGSQPLVGWCSPYCEEMRRRYCCLTSSFPIVNTCLSCKDTARQICAMVPRWRIFGDFFASCIFSEPRAACFDLHPSVVTTIELSLPLRWVATIEPPPPLRCCTVLSVVFSALFPENCHHYSAEQLQSSKCCVIWFDTASLRHRLSSSLRVCFCTRKWHVSFHILCRITDRLCLQLPGCSQHCTKWIRRDSLT